MNIRLCEMTKELARQYYKGFEMDPDLFMDMEKFRPYVYSAEKCDETVARYQRMGRVFLAIMTLGIHLQNDSVKNKGYGTQAEILALQYAFKEMKLNTVYADAIRKNKRSQHVLKKVGFVETRQDDTFIYYRCDKDRWKIQAGTMAAESV